MSPRHAPWADAPPDFAIGLKPIPEADWLEGGEPDPALRKDALYAAERAAVWGDTLGSRDAQAEVLALVEAAVGASGQAGLPALYAASRLVPDDLCLMTKSNAWRLAAISLSAGGFFTAQEALGKSLAELHGPVPGFDRRFLTRVERIFDGLREGLILERRNWTVLNTGELFTPDSAPIRARLPDITPADAADALFIRVERQTLRRLPATGGVLFTIRVWRDPLASLRDDPARLAAFAKAWRGASADLIAYKRFDLYDELVEGFLRASGE